MKYDRNNDNNLLARIRFFFTPNDGRYEDLKKGSLGANIMKDLTAGLVVAMVAIPLAMGFAMASGLKPEQGIVGGAVAGLLGALFGGSKYQVYGPTAAYIPVIGGIMATYSHGFLVLASCVAGLLLIISGLLKFGKIVEKVPHSIVVGFTIGIAIVIAMSQAGEIFGFKEKIGYGLVNQIKKISSNISTANIYCIILGLATFAICRAFLIFKVTPYLPGPLVALAFGYLTASTFWSDKGLVTIKDKYNGIPTDFTKFTPPVFPEQWTGQVIYDLIYFGLAIYFVAAIESLLCSRMADRLANNKGVPYNPNKELFGQGMVNIFTPLFNGFPHTGALARTAVNIKLGAVSPLAGIAKFAFKLLMAAFLAVYLEQVPMACIGGILLYVATGMVKKKEVQEVFSYKNNFHLGLMIFTAIMVPVFDFLTAVISAIIIYAVFYFLQKKKIVSLPAKFNPVLEDQNH